MVQVDPVQVEVPERVEALEAEGRPGSLSQKESSSEVIPMRHQAESAVRLSACRQTIGIWYA